MSDTKIGWGASVWMEDETNTLTELAEVIELAIPNPQIDEVEATHFKSPDRSKEYIPGLKDNGEISIGMNFIAGSDTDLLITAALQTVRGFMVVVPTIEDAGGWAYTFDGLLKGYEKNVPIGDRQTATITIRVSGAVTEESAELS